MFKYADPSNWGRSLLEGNKDHVLSQAKTELMRQEHQVGSLNNCISELQQQAYAERLELQDAQHGYIESRREQVCLQEELSMKEKVLRDTQIRSMGEMKRAQELRVDEVPVQKSRENHETIQRVTARSSSRNSPLRNKQRTRVSSTSYRVGDSFSQEMTNKMGTQFRYRHLQEGRRLREGVGLVKRAHTV